MQCSRKTTVLCLLGLTVCGRASTSPTPDKGRADHTIEQPRRAEHPAPKDSGPKPARKWSPPSQEPKIASSALEYFEDDLDDTVEELTPFANGTKDPDTHIDTLKKTYEKLYPLDEFFAYYSADHRDEIPEGTREAIQKFRASVGGLSTMLLMPEESKTPQTLENFINHTLDNIEDIRPVLRELEAP